MKKEIIKEIKFIPVVLVQAYDLEMQDGSLANVILVELIESDPDKALAKAKTLFPDKKFFRIHQYLEKEIIK
jgi:hypothetical protein